MAQDWNDLTSTAMPHKAKASPPPAGLASPVVVAAVAPPRPDVSSHPGQSAERAKPTVAPVAAASPPPGQRYAFEDQTATTGGFSTRPRQSPDSTGKTSG